MTGDRLPLAASTLAAVLVLSGCATTHTGGPSGDEASTVDAKSPTAAIKGTRVVSTGTGLSQPEDPLALRAPARVMRIWIAPWEDSRGDLHAPGYLYTEIEPRRWTLDARDEHMPRIRPLQIERRDAQPNTSRSGRASQGNAGATRVAHAGKPPCPRPAPICSVAECPRAGARGRAGSSAPRSAPAYLPPI